MSYQQKKSLVTLLSGIVFLISYCIFVSQHYLLAEYATDTKAWAIAMLSFIGIAIVVMIIIQIVFHILLSIGIAVKEAVKNEIEKEITGTKSNEKIMDKVIDRKIKSEMIEDERDHMIELKSLRVGYYVSGTGIIGSIVALALGYSPIVMLNILFLSCMIGGIVEGVVQYFSYAKD